MHNHIKQIHDFKKLEIHKRLKEFELLWLNGSDEEIFAELAFCILTPQSKAKVCWAAIVRLRDKNLLLRGNAGQISQELVGVRFKNNKARYMVMAREFFTKGGRICIKPLLKQFSDVHPVRSKPDSKSRNTTTVTWTSNGVHDAREWLVKNIKGIGYKEASHFLRNIGFGEKIAILDRHILRNLKALGVIEEIPKSISRSKYMHIEKDMKDLAKQLNIPISHLDIVFWCKETGEIFK